MNAIQYFEWGGNRRPTIGEITLLGKSDKKNFIAEGGGYPTGGVNAQENNRTYLIKGSSITNDMLSNNVKEYFLILPAKNVILQGQPARSLLNTNIIPLEYNNTFYKDYQLTAYEDGKPNLFLWIKDPELFKIDIKSRTYRHTTHFVVKFPNNKQYSFDIIYDGSK